MTEATNSELDVSEVKQRYVVKPKEGRVEARRFHVFKDCPMVRERDPGDSELIEVTVRESELLGLKVCSTCEKRETGGPAIEALKEIVLAGDFGHTLADETGQDPAWVIYNGLKSRGFYIAQRRS